MNTTTQTNLIAPSPVFYGVLGLTVAFGVLLFNGTDLGGIGVFLFVLAGWVLSLTMHEFGHAVVAYIGGDRSVAHKGYLTLDVRKYTDPQTSLLFPILILAIGGIGLPGGAVWIQMGAIRSSVMRSLTSAAGPIATGIGASICLLPLRFELFDVSARPLFATALAFLGAMQVIGLVLNLAPIPGLDGYGIIEPHLSAETRRSLEPVRQYGMMVFFVALWFVAPVREAFWDITDVVSEILGGELTTRLWRSGFREFQFWR